MLYENRPAWRNQWLAIGGSFLILPLFIIALFVGADAGIAAGLLIFLPAIVLMILYRRFSWKFTVSRENVESHQGIIGRNVKSIRLQDLRNVNVNQSFFQRIFGIGNIEFSSAGGAGIEVLFFGILDPMKLKRSIDKLRAGAA